MDSPPEISNKEETANEIALAPEVVISDDSPSSMPFLHQSGMLWKGKILSNSNILVVKREVLPPIAPSNLPSLEIQLSSAAKSQRLAEILVK